MKKTILIITTTLIMTGASYAQNTENNSAGKDESIKTIFGNKKLSHGGYGALTIGYSQIDRKDAFTAGFRCAWIIGHSFAIGVGGTGYCNDLYVDNSTGSQEYSLEGGYGGLILEPIVLPKFPVHLSFPVLLGAGGTEYIHSTYLDEFNPNVYMEDSDAFLIAEPGVELEMNLLRFVRIAFSASYRFTSDVHIMNKNHSVLNGYNFGLALKFGKF